MVNSAINSNAKANDDGKNDEDKSLIRAGCIHQKKQ
jgi:hypothetical protein